MSASPYDVLGLLLRELKLPTVARTAEEIATKAEREGWSFGHYLRHLATLEAEECKRLERFLRESDLPAERTLATLDRNLLPRRCRSSFLASAKVRSSTAASLRAKA
jgi:hypothetical protein